MVLIHHCGCSSCLLLHVVIGVIVDVCVVCCLLFAFVVGCLLFLWLFLIKGRKMHATSKLIVVICFTSCSLRICFFICFFSLLVVLLVLLSLVVVVVMVLMLVLVSVSLSLAVW